MKKRTLLVLCMAAGLLCACGNSTSDSSEVTTAAKAAVTEAGTEKGEDTPGETAQGGGNLVVYSMNSEGLMNATIPLFEEKYGITVEVIQAGTGELIKRIQSEKNDPYGDVMFGGSWSVAYDNRDLWQEYVSVNDADIIEAYRNTTGFITPYVLDGHCLIVNKDLIGDMVIESYEDLLNPELKGKIATADPSNSSSAFAQLTNMLLAKGGYESEEAWEFVEKLFTNIDGKIQSGSSGVYKSVADGEMVVGLSYEDPCAQLVKDGAPVQLVYPSEGATFLPGCTMIIKDCKNIDNAKLFVDFITSKEVQDIYGTTLTNRPVYIDAATSNVLTKFSDIHVLEEDSMYIGEHRKEIVEKYTDIFTGVQSR